MLYYEVDISMDCTESKDYIWHITFKLTKCQADVLLMDFSFTFMQRFHDDVTIKHSD